MAELSSTVLSFATGTYNVTRAAGAGTYVDGVYVPPSPDTVIPTVAGVFPLSGRDLQRLTEGRLTVELLQVFTVGALLLAPKADRVSIDGDTWEVETVENWSASGNFYRSIVRKEIV